VNPSEREQVRLGLLRHLDANAGRRFGLAEAVLLQQLRAEGFDLDRAGLCAELEYLRGKGMALPQSKTLSPENRAWQITATGRDEYALLAG
jgi:hypothetical protein